MNHRRLLEKEAALASGEHRSTLQSIAQRAERVGESLERLAQITDAPMTDYLPGRPMVDLARVKSTT